MLHGCTIGEGTLIGIGAVVLNGARVGRNCLIAAKALVGEGKEIPDNSVVMGVPGKVVGEVRPEQAERIRAGSAVYVRRTGAATGAGSPPLGPAVVRAQRGERVAPHRVGGVRPEVGHGARAADAVERVGEDVRVGERCRPQGAEIDREPGFHDGAHHVRPDRGAGGLDQAGVDPVVRVQQHEEPAAAREHEVVERVLLAPAVVVVRVRGLDRPARLHQLDPRVVPPEPRPVVAGEEDAEVRVRLGAHRRQRQVEQGLDQRPVARVRARDQRDPEGERELYGPARSGDLDSTRGRP